jgi:energy-coupling factor transport system permease protein
MKGLKFGQYVKGDSLIHNLDPRTKISGALIIILSTLISSKGLVFLINLAVIILAIILAKIKVKRAIRGIRRLWPLFTITLTLQALLTKGEPFFSLGSLSFSKAGFYLGLLTVLRLIILLLTSSLLTATTSSIKLAAGLEFIFSPLRHFKIPVQQFSMVISIGLRFIPSILQEAETIVMAQKSRGAPFSSPNLVIRLKSIIAVLVPLVAASLQRADDLAEAMESRCYSGEVNRQNINGLCLRNYDFLVIALVSPLLLLSLILR